MTEQRTAGRFSVPGIIAFVLLAAILLGLALLSAIKGVRTAQSTADVVRVEDGQTVVVNMDGTEQTVTLAGVRAPLPPDDGQEATADNCLAEESAEHLAGMLQPGASVQLEFPDDQDGPDDTQQALVRSGGQVVNIAQVEAGLAVPEPEQPLEQLGTELLEAQETARTQQTGLYSASVECTLAGRVAPVIAMLEDVPGERPESAEQAEQRIKDAAAAVEQGVAVEKVFGTIDPEGLSLSSLAWAEDAPRLHERLDEALSGAESELASLESTRNVILTREREREQREREQAQREAEAARQAELAQQRETARQEQSTHREEPTRPEGSRRQEPAVPTQRPSSSSPQQEPSSTRQEPAGPRAQSPSPPATGPSVSSRPPSSGTLWPSPAPASSSISTSSGTLSPSPAPASSSTSVTSNPASSGSESSAW